MAAPQPSQQAVHGKSAAAADQSADAQIGSQPGADLKRTLDFVSQMREDGVEQFVHRTDSLGQAGLAVIESSLALEDWERLQDLLSQGTEQYDSLVK